MTMHASPSSRRLLLALVSASALLAACATPPKSLYQWDGYQPQVYEYFKGKTSPQEQLDALQQAQQKILAKGAALPPGFHAQLGLLYANLGQDQQAAQEFAAEEQAFPESAGYMDFLLKRSKQQ